MEEERRKLTNDDTKQIHLDDKRGKEVKKEIKEWVIIIGVALFILYLLNSCSERKESDCYCEDYEKVPSGGTAVYEEDSYDYNCLKWSKACQDILDSY